MSVRDTLLLNILSWCRNVTLRSSFYPSVGTWHPIHILSWYRNVSPNPYTILVSECDTRSIFYPGTGTWHPIHIISWRQNMTLRSSYTILVLERGTRSPNLTTFVHQAFFYTKASSLTKYIRVSFQDLGFNSFIVLIISQLHNHIHESIQLRI